MPGKSIPTPDNYIVWRDNQGHYHAAYRPPDLRPPFPSRTRAVQWLWGEFGRMFTPNVWNADAENETEKQEEEVTNHG